MEIVRGEVYWGRREIYFLVILKVSKPEIKIKLPNYIENIFQNASIDWEIDHLKSIFDDRDFNIKAFYTLNLEIYKDLVINKNFQDTKFFLKVKKNLFYCSKWWIFNNEIDFQFSKYFNEPNFIEKEINKVWTGFDIFYHYFYKKDSNNVIKYLKKLGNIHDIFISHTNYDSSFEVGIFCEKFINKEDIFKILNEVLFKININDYIKQKGYKAHKLLIPFISKKWLLLIKELKIRNEILGMVNNEFFLPCNDLMRYVIESSLFEEFMCYLNIDEVLKEWFEEYNNYMGFIKKLCVRQKGIEYLDWLWLSKSIIKENNRNFDWLVEKLSNTEHWKEYLKSISNEKVNKALWNEKKTVKIKDYHNITIDELNKIKEWKIKIEDKLYEILRCDAGIKFLEENYDTKKISKELIKNPRLFANICNINKGVRYLRKLKLDEEIIEQIKKENSKWQIYATLSHLLKCEEWIKYLRKLNRNDILKENLLKEVLVFSVSEYTNLEKYEWLYIKDNFQNVLLWKHIWAEWEIWVFFWLLRSEIGIQIIIDSEFLSKAKLFLNEYYEHYSYSISLLAKFPNWRQYLKDILNLESCKLKNELTNFIKTSDSGSCLLSWYRGTWKTSLLKSVVTKVQNEIKNDEEIIQVIVNIPEQKKDENGDKKSFNKNELLTKIIREIYHSLEKIDIKWSEIKDFEEQYIRTFNSIDNIQKDEKSNTLKLDFSIKDFLIFVITTVFIIYGWNIEIIKDNNLLQWILVILWFIWFKLSLWFIHKKSNSTIIKNLYTDEIAEFRLTENIKKFTTWKNKKRKLVIIIDELDKLLDLEIDNSWNTASIKDIFDVLWKLKTLFFDNTWAIFFVVTNKDAYNYYLENKHCEDDLISNIFNKVLYLPMSKKENFNINRTFEIEWIDEKNKDKNDKRKNQYFNDWIYYKSHWNWRKANFILNQESDKNEIKLNKNDIEYEMNFYKFMDELYNLFNLSDKEKFDKNFIPDTPFYEFINTFILDKEFSLDFFNIEKNNYNDDYQWIISKTLCSLKKLSINSPDNKVEIKNKLLELTEKYIDLENSFNTFAYLHSSVEKISNQPAYHDFVMNSILNIIEILKHDRTLRIEDILWKLKFTEIDIKYPAFEDLVLIYIPFLVYYFDNNKNND